MNGTGSHVTNTTLQRQFTEGSGLNDLARRMKTIGVQTIQPAREAHALRLNAATVAAQARFRAAIGDSSFTLPDALAEDEADPLDNPRLMNAHDQLGKLFFGRFHVKPTVFSPTTGRPSLDENALKHILGNPAVPASVKEATRALLVYRENIHTKRIYVDRLAPQCLVEKGGKKNKHFVNMSYLWGNSTLLHATWNPLQAKTGRWSCSDPNLMNIQKTEEANGVLRPGMRDMFGVRDPDYWLVEADYKQLEVRIIAALAGCDKMIEAFNRGDDIYSFIAEGLFKTKRDLWTKQQWKTKRGMAKIFVLASNYGGGIPVIHAQMVVVFPEITPKICEGIQKRFYEEYPEIPAYQKRMFAFAKKEGYVVCPISGRQGWFYLDRVKPTEAANWPIQGTAADIINPASLRLDAALDWAHEWLLMQIHDALYVETKDVATTARRMKSCMEGSIKLGDRSVRFDIDVQFGKTWATMQEWKEAA